MSSDPTTEYRTRPEPSGGGWGQRILYLVLLLALAAGLVWLFGQGASTASAETGPLMTHKVEKGRLVVSLTENGGIESASNINMKCEIAGGSSILWIVEDGEEVSEGDKLVEFDSSALEDSISAQTIVMEKAKSTYVQAQKNQTVAELAVQEYLEGTYKKLVQEADAAITIAMENLRSSENVVKHAERMFRKGQVSELELESKQFSVQRAQLELDAAKTTREVLEKFEKVKMLEDLKSQVETAKAAVRAEEVAYQLEEARLERLKAQLEKSVLYAPQSGMAVYAKQQMGRRMSSSQSQIELGASVRERQTFCSSPTCPICRSR